MQRGGPERHVSAVQRGIRMECGSRAGWHGVEALSAEALSIEKKKIRKEMLQRRDALTEAQRREAAVLLTERILGHQWFYRSDILLGFAAYGSEISTEEILREALRQGKRVYLPRVLTGQEERQTTLSETARSREEQQMILPATVRDREERQAVSREITAYRAERPKKPRRMEFYRIDSFAELQPGYRGIPEPPWNGEQYVFSAGEEDRVLMLMPGVAFDPYRNRLGYGGGFYDRYLADQEELRLRTIGVGFRCQMTEQLPAEESDVKPYQVICV